MNILHVAPISFKKSSGLSVIIPEIIKYQNKELGVNSGLLNVMDIKDQEYHNLGFYYSNLKTHYKIKHLDPPFNQPNIVILHSTYQIKHIGIVKELQKANIPYILFPHGGLTIGAQNKNKLKKRIANFLFFNNIVRNAKKIHFLSEGEANQSKVWKKEYFVIGNGITLPDKMKKSYRTIVFNINFIGRLDIKTKGIDHLLKAANLCKDTLYKNNAVINIYGPDDNGSFQGIESYINKNELNSVVKLHGPVYDKDKEEVYLRTDLFILLSRNEGLPTGVLEALSYGIPCLLTPGTNLSSDAECYRFGWETTSNINDIAQKIQYILEEFNHFKVYGQNARKYIDDYYSWESVTKKSISEYKKLL